MLCRATCDAKLVLFVATNAYQLMQVSPFNCFDSNALLSSCIGRIGRSGGNRTHITPAYLAGASRVYKARPKANISNTPI